MMDMKKILKMAIDEQASDVHLNVGMAPIFRKNTELLKTDFEVVSNENAEKIVTEMVGPERFRKFKENRDIDFVIFRIVAETLSTAVKIVGIFKADAIYFFLVLSFISLL